MTSSSTPASATPSEAAPPPPKRRRWRRRLAFAFAGLLVVLALAFGVVQSPPGKNWLAARINALTEGTGAAVRIEGLAGTVPTNFTVARITISDAAGVWLEIDHAALRWRPLALASRALRVTNLSAERIALLRAPAASGDETPKEPFTARGLLDKVRGLPVVHAPSIAVGRIEIAEGFLPEAAAYRLSGALESGADRGRTVRLHATGLDELPAALTLDASIDPSAETIALAIALDEAAGGWIGRLATLPSDEPVAARIAADGPLAALPLSVELSVGDTPLVTAKGEAALLDALSIALDGASVVPPAMRPENAGTLLDEPIRFTLRSALDASHAAATASATIAGAGIAGAFEAEYVLDSAAADGQARIEIADASVYSALAGEPLAGGLTLDATASGPADALRFTLNLAAPAISRSATAVEGLRFAAQGALTKGDDGPLLNLTGDGAIASLRDPQLPALDGPFAEWTIALDHGEALRLEAPVRFPAIGGAVTLTLTGDARAESGAYALRIDLPDTAAVAKLAGLNGSGAVQADASGAFHRSERRATATIAASGAHLSGYHEHLHAVAGEAFTLDVEAAFAEERLSVANLKLTSGNAALSGSAAYALDSKSLDTAFTASIARLADFSALAGRPLAGSLHAEGRANHNPGETTTDIALRADDLAVDGRAFQGFTAKLDTNGPPEEVKGAVALALWDRTGRLEAKGAIARDGAAYTLTDAMVDGPGLRIRGAGVWTGDAAGASGEIAVDAADLAELGVFLAMDLSGAADLRAALTASNVQRLEADGAATDLRLPGFAVEFLEISADLEDPFAAPRGAGAITLRGANAGETRIDAVGAVLRGDGDAVAIEAEAAASAPVAAALKASASVAIAEAGQTLTVSALDGTVEDLPIALEGPAVVRFAPSGFSAEPMRIAVAEGAVELQGGIEGGEAGLTLKAGGFPLSLASRFGGPAVDGAATANLTLGGPVEAPDIRVTVDVAGLAPMDERAAELTPIDIGLEAALSGGVLEAELTATNMGDEPSRAEVRIPAAFALSPFAFRMDDDAPLRGSAALRVDTARAAVLLPSDQILRGILAGDIAIGGTLDAPALDGALAMSDGYYENISSGTVLTDIRLDALFDGQGLTLRTLEVHDGEGGSARVEGTAAFAPEPVFAFDAAFDAARLVRLDIADATVDGTASVRGNADGAEIAGDLTVSPMTIRIPGSAGPDVPTLDVREAGAERPDTLADESAGPAAYPVDLAVAVSMPGAVYVNGRGLRSEWRGNVTASGPAAAPELGGRLTIVEGDLDFMSKSFQLVNCSITLDGPVPLDPLVDITAQRQQTGLVARLRIIGPASAPQVRLESDPPMPQDDILAYILFGRPLSDLGPSQALQVVRAARALSGASGTGSAFNVTGHMQQALGLDTLNFDASAGLGAASVGIGKRFSDKIYVEVNQGLGGTGSGVSATMDLTDDITVEASSSASGGGGAAIKYKRDY